MAFYTAKITRIHTVKINSIFFYTAKFTCNLTRIYTVKINSILLNIFPFLRRKIRKLCTQFTSCQWSTPKTPYIIKYASFSHGQKMGLCVPFFIRCSQQFYKIHLPSVLLQTLGQVCLHHFRQNNTPYHLHGINALSIYGRANQNTITVLAYVSALFLLPLPTILWIQLYFFKFAIGCLFHHILKFTKIIFSRMNPKILF